MLCNCDIEAKNNFLLDRKFQILTNKTTSEYTLPIFLNKSEFDDSLLTFLQTLKEYVSQYKQQKEIFDLKERHDIDKSETPNKISLLTTLLCTYLCS